MVEVFIDQSLLQIWPRQAGESLVTIAADDGHHPPVSVAIRVLVHPAAHPPAEADFSFHHWTLPCDLTSRSR